MDISPFPLRCEEPLCLAENDITTSDTEEVKNFLKKLMDNPLQKTINQIPRSKYKKSLEKEKVF